MAKKTCFMISPIGDEGTEVRKEADALLWVAKRALEKFDFQVVRVDQIARSTTITNEIIQLIQEAELCLIVLTGHNPNVFYEAGRRHETGRPFIQLIRKGEPLPFDVASIRTIMYDDIQSLTTAAKAVEKIQKFVEEFEKGGGGYGASGTGVSLSTIASALDRIERKVGQIMSGSTSPPPIGLTLPDALRSSASDEERELEELIPGLAAFSAAAKDPRKAFLEAILTGNLREAAQLLPVLEPLLPPKEFTASALMLVAVRHEPAVEIVLNMLEEHFDELGELEDEKEPIIRSAIGGVVQFYTFVDREEEGLARLKPVFDRITSDQTLSREAEAWYRNQYQKLLWGTQAYDEALAIAREVVELDPEDPAYWFNLSLICEKIGRIHEAVEAVDRYMALDTNHDSHLHQAVEIYAKTGRIEDAKEAFAKLKEISPLTAMAFDREVRAAIGIKFPGQG